MILHPQRCETCNKKSTCKWNHNHIADWMGCASHSTISENKVLDELFAPMDTFFGTIPMDKHIIQWAVSKQNSFVTAAMATYLEYRKLCAGKQESEQK
jgi:hypothetical protein